MHDGSRIVLRKCEAGYDPTDRGAAAAYIQERMKAGEYLTGLLYVEPSQNEFHEVNATPDQALNSVPTRSCARSERSAEDPRSLSLAALPLAELLQRADLQRGGIRGDQQLVGVPDERRDVRRG